MKSSQRKADKSVFDIQATVLNVVGLWRRIAISADATLPELYRTVAGAFGWSRPMYGELTVNERLFGGSVGSRTRLRSIFRPESSCALGLADENYQFLIILRVERRYEVASRRHYPKVPDGEGSFYSSHRQFWSDFATRDAQDTARYGWPGD